ncbi:anti-sigma factor family protein [Nocardia australiensis]|uniref:anti-sigma factor family protein n=1 Tax=Nocardia australiensis TaxID=2887191 RepID=UPI001D15356D|nr:zf-HC2 domain-containing protein [Nocardia australiensis]
MINPPAHEHYQLMLGGYVLGGLTAADRAAVDTHIADCRACRRELAEFAVIPSLLATAPEPHTAETEPSTPSASLFSAAPRSMTAARRSQRRRTITSVLGTAAAALVVGAAIGVAAVDRPSEPVTDQVVALTAGSGAAHGEADLAARPWGTEIRLNLASLPAGQRLMAVAIDADGRVEPAATWVTPALAEIRVAGAVAIPTNAVRRIEIRTDTQALLVGTVN